jgi:hypothetical protein
MHAADSEMRTHSIRRLTLEPLTGSAWRLCDESVAPSNAESLIAYVEQRDDGCYEVMWIAHGFGSATYNTMGELLSSASALLAKPPVDLGPNLIRFPRRRPLTAL